MGLKEYLTEEIIVEPESRAPRWHRYIGVVFLVAGACYLSLTGKATLFSSNSSTVERFHKRILQIMPRIVGQKYQYKTGTLEIVDISKNKISMIVADDIGHEKKLECEEEPVIKCKVTP